ncbi:hypothetical protein KCU74_g385, partial [Aureobasidium melanogenum]
MPEIIQTVQEGLTTLRRVIDSFKKRVRELSDSNDPLDPREAYETLEEAVRLLIDHARNFSDGAEHCTNKYDELRTLIIDLKDFKEEIKSIIATNTEQVSQQNNDQLTSHLDEFDNKLAGIDESFDGIDRKLNTLNESVDQKLNTLDENVDQKLNALNANFTELKTMMHSILTSRPSHQSLAMSEIHSIEIAPSLPKMEKPKQRVGVRMRIWEFLRGLERGM